MQFLLKILKFLCQRSQSKRKIAEKINYFLYYFSTKRRTAVRLFAQVNIRNTEFDQNHPINDRKKYDTHTSTCNRLIYTVDFPAHNPVKILLISEHISMLSRHSGKFFQNLQLHKLRISNMLHTSY
jgi:hypothetical protein